MWWRCWQRTWAAWARAWAGSCCAQDAPSPPQSSARMVRLILWGTLQSFPGAERNRKCALQMLMVRVGRGALVYSTYMAECVLDLSLMNWQALFCRGAILMSVLLSQHRPHLIT